MGYTYFLKCCAIFCVHHCFYCRCKFIIALSIVLCLSKIKFVLLNSLRYEFSGAGSSVMLVTSLGITADLIGPNIESGAFVYGTMSFMDKLSNGVAVTVIQDL